MKVLLISVRADFGGGPEHIYRLIQAFQNQDIQSYVACPPDYPYFNRYVEVLGSESVIPIEHRKFTIKAFLRLLRFCNSRQIDLLHSHGKGAGLYSRLLRLMNGIPVVHTFHGVHTDEYKGIKRKIYIALERFMLLLTRRCINVSKGEREKALKLGFTSEIKASLIFNGVSEKKHFWSNNNLENEINILSITRFDYAKNPHLLFEIFENLQKMHQDRELKLTIVGITRESKELQKEIQDRGLAEKVQVLGMLDSVEEELLKTSIYLSTSRWEGMPLALMDAMSYGIPCVASEVIGNRDLLEHETSGLLYKSENAQDACQQISRLLLEPGLAQTLSKGARKTVVEDLSLANMGQKTLHLYQETV